MKQTQTHTNVRDMWREAAATSDVEQNSWWAQCERHGRWSWWKQCGWGSGRSDIKILVQQRDWLMGDAAGSNWYNRKNDDASMFQITYLFTYLMKRNCCAVVLILGETFWSLSASEVERFRALLFSWKWQVHCVLCYYKLLLIIIMTHWSHNTVCFCTVALKLIFVLP